MGRGSFFSTDRQPHALCQGHQRCGCVQNAIIYTYHPHWFALNMFSCAGMGFFAIGDDIRLPWWKWSSSDHHLSSRLPFGPTTPQYNVGTHAVVWAQPWGGANIQSSSHLQCVVSPLAATRPPPNLLCAKSFQKDYTLRIHGYGILWCLVSNTHI